MTIVQAALLGFLQGLTEFLPVSSDGHLAVTSAAMGIEQPLFFTVLLHAATLGAIVVYFWRSILVLRLRQWFTLAVATIPVGLVGVIFSDQIEASFSLLWVAVAGFTLSGAANALSQLKLLENKSVRSAGVEQKSETNSMTSQSMKWPGWTSTLIIGAFQSIALLPGASRSGLTVMGGLWRGLDRTTAFRFSFLMAIPAIVGATGLEFFKHLSTGFTMLPQLPALLIGMVVAFGTGLVAIKLLEIMMVRAQLWVFAVYCFVVAGGLAVWLVSV